MQPLFTLTAACVAAAATVAPAWATVVITQWNFNGPVGVNNAPMPSIGLGSATPVGMNSGANNADIGNTTGSSDPASPNQHWRVRGSVSNGWSGTTQLLSGARFDASTVGYFDIIVTLDVFATDGSPRHAQFQYTLDGLTFTSLGPILDFNPTNDRWRNGLSFDLSGIPGATDNAAFGFRIVSAFSPVPFTNANGLQPANTAFQRADAGNGVYTGAAGNYRFDMVTFSGTVIPTPGALAVLAGAGALAFRRRR